MNKQYKTISEILNIDNLNIDKTIIEKGIIAALNCGDFSIKSKKKYNYKIKSIKLDDIVQYDKAKYNSNNHWINNTRPENYDKVLAQTDTSKWINEFKQFKQINISNPIWLNWLKQANEICSQTGNFSQLFEDEMNEICSGLETDISQIFNGTGYFVRVNNVSLKYGQHKEGPYYSLRQILESVVSCIRGHTPIKPDTTNLDIYLMEWIEILPEYEFRVFVYQNKITAISQQNIYSLLLNTNPNIPNHIFELEMKEKLDIIVEYFYNTIVDKVNWINSYTIDIAIINSQAYFIELNSFGKEYAAGSALFHWLLDESILYNKFKTNENTIEFRYTIN